MCKLRERVQEKTRWKGKNAADVSRKYQEVSLTELREEEKDNICLLLHMCFNACLWILRECTNCMQMSIVLKIHSIQHTLKGITTPQKCINQWCTQGVFHVYKFMIIFFKNQNSHLQDYNFGPVQRLTIQDWFFSRMYFIYHKNS